MPDFQIHDRVQWCNKLAQLGTVLEVIEGPWMRGMLHIKWDDGMESDVHPSEVRKCNDVKGPY